MPRALTALGRRRDPPHIRESSRESAPRKSRASEPAPTVSASPLPLAGPRSTLLLLVWIRLCNQDPRYYRSSSTGFWRRIAHRELFLLTKLAIAFELFEDELDAVNNFFPDRAPKPFDVLSFVQHQDDRKFE
jgi:hypothetical protein